jgi:hypothetical protein
VYAQGAGNNCQQQGNNNGNNVPCVGPNLLATPELDSLALFGTGAVGIVGYAVMRLRAARRREEGHEVPPIAN